MNELIKTNSLLNLVGEGEKLDFLPQQNLRKERDIWYKIKLIYSVLIKKISSLLSVDYYKSNNENQFKDIQLQLHAIKVTNPYTFSIQGNKSFSGICELDKPSYVIAYGSKPWYYSEWPDASKVLDLTTINGGVKFSVKNVTNTGGMFYMCSGLTSLDLSNFNTSNVTDMGYMFRNCSKLISLDLSNFDTSNVTNNMVYMFYRCSALETLDYSLTGFEANGIAPDLSGCTNLKTLRLHHATPSYVDNFIVQSKVPSTCNVIQVS